MSNISTNAVNKEDEDEFEITQRKRWTFFGLPLTFTTYTLNERKIVVRSGFFTTVEDEIRLFRVSDIALSRTLFQKMFGLATITVLSSDKSCPELKITNIKNFKFFKDLLEESIEKERLRTRVRASELVGIDDFEDCQDIL